MDEKLKEILEGTIEYENDQMVSLKDEDEHSKRAKAFTEILKQQVEEDKIASEERIEFARMEHEKQIKQMELEHERKMKEEQMQHEKELKEKELNQAAEQAAKEEKIEYFKIFGEVLVGAMGIGGTLSLAKGVMEFEKTGVIRGTAFRLIPRMMRI